MLNKNLFRERPLGTTFVVILFLGLSVYFLLDINLVRAVTQCGYGDPATVDQNSGQPPYPGDPICGAYNDPTPNTDGTYGNTTYSGCLGLTGGLVENASCYYACTTTAPAVYACSSSYDVVNACFYYDCEVLTSEVSNQCGTASESTTCEAYAVASQYPPQCDPVECGSFNWSCEDFECRGPDGTGGTSYYYTDGIGNQVPYQVCESEWTCAGPSPTPTPTSSGPPGSCQGDLSVYPTGASTINVGETAYFSLAYDDGNGPQPLSCSGEVWTSDNPSVASLSNVECGNNVASYLGVGQGTTNVRASFMNCQTTTPITVNAQTLSVGFTANPNSGLSPVNSTLSASVGGTATGTINYSFWWNCTNTSTSVATVQTACGSLPTPSSGNCQSNANGYKCNSVNTNPRSTSAHAYSTNSTAKVIVERGAASPVQAQTSITVNQPTLTVSLTANPSSGPPPLNSNISASVGGTATGTINYSFWWNCTNTSTSVATVQTACGSLPTPSSGNCQSNANGYKCNSVNTNPRSTSHSYSSNSTVKVIVERGTASPAEARRAITMANGGPVTSNVRATEPNYCSSGPAVTVSWIYSDPEGQTQSAYQVQVDDTGSAWNIPMFDSGKISGSGISYFQNGLAFNTTYKSRVRTWDSLDLVGNWTEQSLCAGPGCLGGGNTWRTPRHAYPIPNFTWSPATPTANQQVQFTDQTQFFDGGNGNGRDWNWFFGDGGSSTNQNPGHTYTSSNIYNVTETATDRDDYSCSISRLVNVGQSIPVWIEVNPR